MKLSPGDIAAFADQHIRYEMPATEPCTTILIGEYKGVTVKLAVKSLEFPYPTELVSNYFRKIRAAREMIARKLLSVTGKDK